MRDVAVHYHLFKNAGSSIDRILERAFGDAWVSFDPKPDRLLSATELAAVIDSHPDAKAFSSHLIVPPLPGTRQLERGDAATVDDGDSAAALELGTTGEIADSEVGDAGGGEPAARSGESPTDEDAPPLPTFRAHPIVVLRDPILRVRSAYLFEWQKQQNAKEPIGSLADYVREKFRKPRANAIEDFQTLRLAVTDPRGTRPPRARSDIEVIADASAFIASLPAFGLVERFDESLELFERTFRPIFPELVFHRTRANSTQSVDVPAHERHARIRAELGEELHAELVARNQMDIALYRYALGRFDVLCARADKVREAA